MPASTKTANVARSPFSITFGKMPGEHIPRLSDEETIIEGFLDESTHAFMISGVRGSGKTVLLVDVSRKFAEQGWIIIELNPTTDMLRSLAAKLYDSADLAKEFIKADINLSLFGIGVSMEHVPPVSDVETAISRMLEVLRRKNRRVLIVIDEVTNSANMRQLASAFQIFLRNDAPVYLLMTGLYNNLKKLQNREEITFLLRTPQVILQPLRLQSIRDSYQKILSVDSQTADEMTHLTRGYAYAYQVLGYLYWRKQREHGGDTSIDLKDLLPQLDAYLYDFVYDKIWSELSETDRRVAAALAARGGTSAVRTLCEDLNMSGKHFSVYRDRARKKGLLDTSVYGQISFILPRFTEFVLGTADLH